MNTETPFKPTSYVQYADGTNAKFEAGTECFFCFHVCAHYVGKVKVRVGKDNVRYENLCLSCYNGLEVKPTTLY